MNQPRRRIAVVGGGVAGIVSAWLLSKRHEVTLFEANNYVGGHTNSVEIPSGPDAGTRVDTGFIVMNDRTYPNMHLFLRRMGVRWRYSDMSFGFHCEQTGFQYAGTDLRGLFAQRVNALNPGYYRFLAEIVRFGRVGKRDLDEGALEGLTMEDFLRENKFSRRVARDYVLPMGAAIWSTPAGKMRRFPAETMIRFFDHHGLLDLRDRPRWQTVVGGSQSYVRAFLAKFSGTVRTSTPIESIRRTDGGAEVIPRGGAAEAFDGVVVSAHADQALRLLADPSEEERRLLGAWRYEHNRTVLHTDVSVMPPLRDAWASWNYTRERGGDERAHMSMTYDMNRLMGLRTRRRYLVTLNRAGDFARGSVIREFDYAHPLYDRAALDAQRALPSLQGVRNTWFAGSYFGYGFHEDAVRSAVDVGRRFGVEL